MSHVNASESHEFNQLKQLKTTSNSESDVVPGALAAPTSQSIQTSEPEPASWDKATLLQELAATRQRLQSQESLVELLTKQLASSQARIVRLEADLGLVQQRQTQQSHLLQETETACLDLRARLLRQQRQTFQFKAALEKCLEPSPPQNSLYLHQNYTSAASTHAVAELRMPSPIKGTFFQPDCTDVDFSDYPTSPVGSLPVSQTRSGDNPQDAVYSRGTKSSPEPELASVQTDHFPLVFKEQPIQPWSAADPQLVISATAFPHQSAVDPASLLQAKTSDMNQAGIQSGSHPSDSIFSIPPHLQPSPTHFTVQASKVTSPADNSSPIAAATKLTLEPFQRPQVRSQRKSLAAVELPCFPRYQS